MNTILPRCYDFQRKSRQNPATGFASLGLVLALVSCICTSASLGAETKSLSSSTDASATRTSLTTGYVDAWQVGGPGPAGAVTLISLFGYNSGSQQFVQLYDCTNTAAPTLSVTAWAAATDSFTNASHGLSTGQKVQLTGTVATITAGIYYARFLTADSFSLYDTLAHAQNLSATTGVKDVVGSTSTATMNLVPVHFFACGAADNFSCIVPQTGMKFGKGLLITLSTTGPLYTAPTKDAEFYVTLNQGP